MCTRLELQSGVNAAAGNTADDLFIATMLTFPCADNFQRPMHCFGIFRVHAKEIARKNRSFIAARTCPYFEIDVAVIARVRRNQCLLQIQQQFVAAFVQGNQLFLTHLADFVVGVARHLLSGGDVLAKRFVFLE